MKTSCWLHFFVALNVYALGCGGSGDAAGGGESCPARTCPAGLAETPIPSLKADVSGGGETAGKGRCSVLCCPSGAVAVVDDGTARCVDKDLIGVPEGGESEGGGKDGGGLPGEGNEGVEPTGDGGTTPAGGDGGATPAPDGGPEGAEGQAPGTCAEPCPEGYACADSDGDGAFNCELPPVKGEECTADAECETKFPNNPRIYCESGFCVECSVSIECQPIDPTYICQDGFCAASSGPPSCSSNAMCEAALGTGYICDVAQSTCVPKDSGVACTSDAQCELDFGKGAVCDSATQTCKGGTGQSTGKPCGICVVTADCDQSFGPATCAQDLFSPTGGMVCKLTCSGNATCTAAGLSTCSSFSSSCSCGF